MFFLRNLSINPLDIFPKDMPEKLCANFTCKGKECINTNCDFAHPRKALELKHITIFNGCIHLGGKFYIRFFILQQKMEVSNFTSPKYATDDAHWNQA